MTAKYIDEWLNLYPRGAHIGKNVVLKHILDRTERKGR